MSYSVRDVNNDILLTRGTLEAAREAVNRYINTIDFTRNELSSKEIVPTYDSDMGILTEEHILKREDIDERVIFATIKHDSVEA